MDAEEAQAPSKNWSQQTARLEKVVLATIIASFFFSLIIFLSGGQKILLLVPLQYPK
jgi:hypothetical protein